MVSSEGACAAYYNYGRFSKAAGRIEALRAESQPIELIRS
jgi:hypothetical protein